MNIVKVKHTSMCRRPRQAQVTTQQPSRPGSDLGEFGSNEVNKPVLPAWRHGDVRNIPPPRLQVYKGLPPFWIEPLRFKSRWRWRKSPWILEDVTLDPPRIYFREVRSMRIQIICTSIYTPFSHGVCYFMLSMYVYLWLRVFNICFAKQLNF